MDSAGAAPPARCVFCRMATLHRFLRLAMCPICRDQSYDFLWVSGVQTLLYALGAMGGAFFLIDEVLLFVVLVLVRHRIPPPWQRRARDH